MKERRRRVRGREGGLMGIGEEGGAEAGRSWLNLVPSPRHSEQGNSIIICNIAGHKQRQTAIYA